MALGAVLPMATGNRASLFSDNQIINRNVFSAIGSVFLATAALIGLPFAGNLALSWFTDLNSDFVLGLVLNGSLLTIALGPSLVQPAKKPS